MAGGPNRTLKLSYVGDSSGLNKANAQAQSGLEKLGGSAKKFAKVGALAFAAVGVAAGAMAVKIGKDAIKSASDLSESVNALEVTFGDASKGMLALSKNAAVAVGLSRNEFNSLAVSFAGFTGKIADGEKDVVQVTDELTRRVADFASVMNLDLGEAAQVFQSTLAGSSEPARRFGLDMSAAAVELFALENGLVANKSELTEAIKVQARYGLIMQETEKVAGDFGNTSDGLANSQRILAAQLENARATIGEKLLPIMADFTVMLNEKLIPFVIKWGSIIADKVAPVLTAFSEWFRTQGIPRLTELGQRLGDLIGRFREWWQSVAPGVLASFQRLKDPILELWANIKIAWEQTKTLIDAFRSGESDGQGFQRFIEGLVLFIGLLITGLNIAIRAMNRFKDILIRIVESKAFQALLSGIGAIGGAVSRGIGSIAGLAEGGIVTKPTLAMVGEGGEPEAVIPLSKMGKMGGGGISITINGAIDPEGTARQIRRILEDSERRTGARLAYAA